VRRIGFSAASRTKPSRIVDEVLKRPHQEGAIPARTAPLQDFESAYLKYGSNFALQVFSGRPLPADTPASLTFGQFRKEFSDQGTLPCIAWSPYQPTLTFVKRGEKASQFLFAA
jgi:hypothetical protein